MKLVAVTMGNSLDIFLRLFDILQEEHDLEAPGIFVANSYHCKRTASIHESLKEASLLKEWELTNRGIIARPDLRRIQEYEKRLGDPTLWNALLADRRIFFGKLCKVKQDYRPRFGHTQLLGILDTFLVEIDHFLKTVSPDLVLGFSTATLGDYLFYLFSKANNIPYLQLKSTKVKNYVSLNDSAVGISEHLRRRYFAGTQLDEHIIQEARSFLDDIPSKGVQYEGAILSGRKRVIMRLLRSPLTMARGMARSIRMHLDPVTRRDNHLPPPFLSSVYDGFIQPLRALLAERRFHFLTSKELEQAKPFLLYPLHFEPEVSLQVFGRQYQNQIEVVRNLALRVPAGWKVVVKEHPRSLGFRSMSYYRKLLEIPNVRLVNPFLPAITIVKQSQAVAVVSGTVGFEAAVCGKPILVLGKTPYTLLPETMVRHVSSVENLGEELRDLLANYSFDRSATERYVASIIVESVPVDLYTVLYGKKKRFSLERVESTVEQKRRVDYRRLAEYFSRRMQDHLDGAAS